MKKILFVINTLGCAGAETALLTFLRKLSADKSLEISLYILTGQGELISQVPDNIIIKNKKYADCSVLSSKGRRTLGITVFKSFFSNGRFFRKTGYAFRLFLSMVKNKKIQPDKLFWRILSDGGMKMEETYDMAVAYLEGGAAYYVADHVKAHRKVSFIHIDYESAGYTKEMDKDCFLKMDQIFAVSDEAKTHFLNVYPEYSEKTAVFHNLIDQDKIIRMSKEKGGFSDDYKGIRLLTVGRLTYQKAYDIAIEALHIVRSKGYDVRWYILGEGDQRSFLEKKAASFGLKNDFLMPGAAKNPFPYYKQADIYVHATRFEGKSIAIQEAQTLGCTILASDCNGNREQIKQDEDGILCSLDPQIIADNIIKLINDPEKRKRLSCNASRKITASDEELNIFLKLLDFQK